MFLRLTWLCHGATVAQRSSAFPLDEALEEKAVQQSRNLADTMPPVDQIWSSPALRARQTAAFFKTRQPLKIADELADCDYGRWRGQTLLDIQNSEAEPFVMWMQGQEKPHGGESIVDVQNRVRGWIQERSGESGHILVVSHALPMRCAILDVLQAPLSSFWLIDAAPLSLVCMSFDQKRWSLRFNSAHQQKSSLCEPERRLEGKRHN